MRRALAIGVLALALPVSGVGSGSEKLPQRIGKPEGSLVLLQWPGYSHPSFAGDYERRRVARSRGGTRQSSADLVDLMRRGPYDLVSASGDVSGELIARRYVKPVNVKLIPGWRQLAPAFRSPAYNTVGNVHYGVTVLWTPNELLSRSDRAKPAPVFVAGGLRRPIPRQDLRSRQPDAGGGRGALPEGARAEARHPRPLRAHPRQFDAAVALLRRQRPLVARYWQFASEQILDFRTAAAIVGTSWPYQHHVLTAEDVPVRRRVPREGATAWANSWLLARRARHPNCAYLWMRHVLAADVQASQSLLCASRRSTLWRARSWTRPRRAPARRTTGRRRPRCCAASPSGRRRARAAASAAARTACRTSAGSRRGPTSSVDNEARG